MNILEIRAASHDLATLADRESKLLPDEKAQYLRRAIEATEPGVFKQAVLNTLDAMGGESLSLADIKDLLDIDVLLVAVNEQLKSEQHERLLYKLANPEAATTATAGD